MEWLVNFVKQRRLKRLESKFLRDMAKEGLPVQVAKALLEYAMSERDRGTPIEELEKNIEAIIIPPGLKREGN